MIGPQRRLRHAAITMGVSAVVLSWAGDEMRRSGMHILGAVASGASIFCGVALVGFLLVASEGAP